EIATHVVVGHGVIAHELGRFLYRIDLSQVVDKYIGETEKNLGRVFDEAERAQAILLFDEADSLFSKRTDVKSSNDRYANLEVNYLLQRLDDFTGVSILTTNHPQSIDDAFQRRIRFKVEFPMPDHDMRRNLWQRLLPPAAPVDDNIDWDLLAEDFEYSGGHIRNAILRASVRAAARGQGISEALLYDSAVDESRELGQLVRRY
ncbi:MAG: ATP-binding protein, partial [Myxococcota bacterium]